jgi:hypothetical protein
VVQVVLQAQSLEFKLWSLHPKKEMKCIGSQFWRLESTIPRHQNVVRAFLL